MKIYISGSISDDKNYLEKFARVEKQLLQLDNEVVNPCTLPHNHGKTYEEYMKEDIKALLACDTIYMIPGWEKSKGAVFEREVAVMCGLEVLG